MSTSSVLNLVGGVAGFAVGGPVGALVGQGIASAVTSSRPQSLEPIVNESPRLNDLTIQTAEYGTAIKKVYGRQRIAGNIIWARETRIERIETRTPAPQASSGGKGGQSAPSSPDTINVSYNYHQTFLVSICQGPIGGILRIWADRELIYNFNTQDIGTLNQSRKIPVQFALGSESQQPFSLIESFEGRGNVPAYRGQALALFNDWQTNKYYGRIPNLEFEVIS